MAFDLNNAPLLAAPGPPPAVALNTPLQNQEGMMKLQELKQQAIDQARAQQAQDAFRTQLQQNGGDYDSALTALDKQGYNTLPIRGAVADYRKKLYDNGKARLDQMKTENEMMSSLWSGVTDQASQDRIMPLVQRIDPQFASQVKPVYDQKTVDAYKNIGVTAKDQHEWAQKALDDGADQKYAKAAYAAAAATTSDQDVAEARQHMAAALIPRNYIDAALPPGTAWSPDLVASAKKAYAGALTPKEQAEVTNQEAERKNAADTLAETKVRDANAAAYQKGELGVSQGHLAVARADLKLKQAAAAGGTDGAPSDAVLGYRDDIISGASKLSDVPAAHGMRDSVVAQLRKEGYDLNKPLTGQAQARVDLARMVLPQVQEVRDMAQKIDQQGLMGTVGGRWRSILAHESAAGDIAGLTPEQKQLVGQFVAQAEFLSSGTAMTHYGARAGGQVVEQFRDQLDPRNKDLDTYLGNMNAVQSVLGGYAKGMPGATKRAGAGETPAPTTGTTNIADLRKKYNY